MKTTTLSQLKKRLFADPEFKAEYDALHDEFVLINTLLEMRQNAGLTQDQVAKRMGTKEANISRLESGKSNPTFKTLTNYAKACGCELTLGFRASH